jgi:hypothetical protein
MTPAEASALRWLEAGLVTAGGAALGGGLGLLGGTRFAAAAGISAGLNGAFGGYRRVYDWRSPKGWLAFTADSTWGLAGTTLGNVLNLLNSTGRRSGYRPEFSRRQNRHVFENGACLRRGFAVTLGNVISNASMGNGDLGEERRPFIDRHEDLHIWQSRIFGPIYQAVYATWVAGGAVFGAGVWTLRRRKPGLWRLMETAAYYDNPFEFWAYKRDHHWEGNGADPTLKWRRSRWFAAERDTGGDRSGTGWPPVLYEEAR